MRYKLQTNRKYASDRIYLSHIHDQLFTKKVADLKLDYLFKHEYILNYLLNGISHLSKIYIIMFRQCSESKIGNLSTDPSVYGLSYNDSLEYRQKTFYF